MLRIVRVTALVSVAAGLSGCSGDKGPGELDHQTYQDERISQNRNRLANTTSPYLLQHADNPVDWYPWGDEAFEKARSENKPIFLSIGYAACHWCHVMEHESFEDETVAAFLNEHFVSIKVDREQRPDVDEIYMNAVQMMTGSGGWPLTVFLTPDLKPFYGGTYFPPEDRYGRPGFHNLLKMIITAYRQSRDKIDDSIERVMEGLSYLNATGREPDAYSREQVERAVKLVGETFDPFKGGFGPAPKFPPTGQMDLMLLVYHRTGDEKLLQMVEKTLEMMIRGGIFDQLGGGFHRYSTDAEWLVPHFEKMLYDNALMTKVCLDAYLVTGNEMYAMAARMTMDWVLKEMADEGGGFHSSLDADSEGEEGLFYVWTIEELKEALSEEVLRQAGVLSHEGLRQHGDEQIDYGALFAQVYGVSSQGNFENGRNILHVAVDPAVIADRLGLNADAFERRLDGMKQILHEVRTSRTRPTTDDKVLSDWNGLMISAFAQGYRVLGDERYLDAARNAARFFREKMWSDGGLLHSYRNGRADIGGMLDDYAFQLTGSIDLYQAGFDMQNLHDARRIADRMIELFWDDKHGGFYHVAAGSRNLIERTKHARDGAIPSGNAAAAGGLLKLYLLTDNDVYRDHAERTVRALSPYMNDLPTSHLRLASVVEELVGPLEQIAVIGTANESGRRLLDIINLTYLPGAVIAYRTTDAEDELPLFSGRGAVAGKSAAYYCRDFVCKAPVTDAGKLRNLLGAGGPGIVKNVRE